MNRYLRLFMMGRTFVSRESRFPLRADYEYSLIGRTRTRLYWGDRHVATRDPQDGITHIGGLTNERRDTPTMRLLLNKLARLADPVNPPWRVIRRQGITYLQRPQFPTAIFPRQLVDLRNHGVDE
jgi:hypothetical protein